MTNEKSTKELTNERDRIVAALKAYDGVHPNAHELNARIRKIEGLLEGEKDNGQPENSL